MPSKTTATPRVLLAPRKKRKRSISEAHSMIQTRLRRTLRHMKATNQDLREILHIAAEFPPGTFGTGLEKVIKANDSR